VRTLAMLGWAAAALVAAGLSQTEPARMAYSALAATRAPRAALPAARTADGGRQAAAAIAVDRRQIALARLAAERSVREPVREYARQIIAGRQSDLGALAGAAAAAAPSAAADPGPAAEPLAGLKGRAFDRAYLDATIQEQQRGVALLERQAREAGSPDLVAFAFAQLPRLRRELEQAHRLAVLAALAPPDPAPPPARAREQSGGRR